MSHRSFFALTFCVVTSSLCAGEFEGFTEPSRDIDLAVGDSGIVATISVKEGEEVREGQELGNLEQEVLKASLLVADQNRLSQGKLNSSAAELRLRTERLDRLRNLLSRQHASQEEVDRAALEKELADAQLLTTQEEIKVRELEYDRIKRQIELRVLRSPIDGVVTRVRRDQGEYVSASDPVVLTIVQLDPLVAVFSIPSRLLRPSPPLQNTEVAAVKANLGSEENATVLKKDHAVQLHLGFDRTVVTGTVQFVSPITDAQSGSVQVKVRIPNPNRVFRSGEKCSLTLAEAKSSTESQPVPDTKPGKAQPSISPGTTSSPPVKLSPSPVSAPAKASVR